MSVMPLLRKAEKMLNVAASVIVSTTSRVGKEKNCLTQCREAAVGDGVSALLEV